LIPAMPTMFQLRIGKKSMGTVSQSIDFYGRTHKKVLTSDETILHNIIFIRVVQNPRVVAIFTPYITKHGFDIASIRKES